MIDVIAFDSTAMEIELMPKYSHVIRDTGTVISRDDKAIYVTHRDRPTTIYSLETQILHIRKGVGK